MALIHGPLNPLALSGHIQFEESGFMWHPTDLAESQYLCSPTTCDFGFLLSNISTRSPYTPHSQDEYESVTEFNRQCYLFMIQLETLRHERVLTSINGSLQQNSARYIYDDKPSYTTDDTYTNPTPHKIPLSPRKPRNRLIPARPRLTSPLSPYPSDTQLPGPPRRPMPLKRCKATPMLLTALNKAHRAVRERGRNRSPVDIGSQIQPSHNDEEQHSQGENWSRKSWIIVPEDDWVVVEPGIV